MDLTFDLEMQLVAVGVSDAICTLEDVEGINADSVPFFLTNLNTICASETVGTNVKDMSVLKDAS